MAHALDISQAIRRVLEAPREVIHSEVFNLGNDKNNYRVREIAEIVGDVFPGCAVVFPDNQGDTRSYRVPFDKIVGALPDFSCAWDAEKGARQLHSVFSSIDLDEATFKGRGHTRLLQLQHLLRTKQVDEGLYWTRPE